MIATSQSAEVYPISPGQKELFLRGRRGGGKGAPPEVSFAEQTLGTWLHTAGVSRNCGCGLMGLGDGGVESCNARRRCGAKAAAGN